MLVGAVGSESNANWNFKGLQEMLGSTKELARNNRERKGIHRVRNIAAHHPKGKPREVDVRSIRHSDWRSWSRTTKANRS